MKGAVLVDWQRDCGSFPLKLGETPFYADRPGKLGQVDRPRQGAECSRMKSRGVGSRAAGEVLHVVPNS